MNDYNYDDDLDAEQQEDRNAVAIAKRQKETDQKIQKRLHTITRKNVEQLSADDKAFLKARASYLSRADREVYADIIAADYSGQPVESKEPKLVEKPLKKMNRSELEVKALELGLDNLEQYQTNQELIDAIQGVQ